MSNALLSRGHAGLTAPAVAVLATLLTPVPLMAESQMAATVAHGALGLRVVVPPVFRILEVRPQPDHDEVRVWTNMASVRIGIAQLALLGQRLEVRQHAVCGLDRLAQALLAFVHDQAAFGREKDAGKQDDAGQRGADQQREALRNGQ